MFLVLEVIAIKTGDAYVMELRSACRNDQLKFYYSSALTQIYMKRNHYGSH